MKNKIESVLTQLDEATNYFALDDYSDQRISIPDYFMDILIGYWNMEMRLKITKNNNMTYRGINIIPSYENKIIIFNLKSPISQKIKIIELS